MSNKSKPSSTGKSSKKSETFPPTPRVCYFRSKTPYLNFTRQLQLLPGYAKMSLKELDTVAQDYWRQMGIKEKRPYLQAAVVAIRRYGLGGNDPGADKKHVRKELRTKKVKHTTKLEKMKFSKTKIPQVSKKLSKFTTCQVRKLTDYPVCPHCNLPRKLPQLNHKSLKHKTSASTTTSDCSHKRLGAGSHSSENSSDTTH